MSTIDEPLWKRQRAAMQAEAARTLDTPTPPAYLCLLASENGSGNGDIVTLRVAWGAGSAAPGRTLAWYEIRAYIAGHPCAYQVIKPSARLEAQLPVLPGATYLIEVRAADDQGAVSLGTTLQVTV